jgi:hypothetical protein
MTEGRPLGREEVDVTASPGQRPAQVPREVARSVATGIVRNNPRPSQNRDGLLLALAPPRPRRLAGALATFLSGHARGGGLATLGTA